jgi:TatD DNase family protein
VQYTTCVNSLQPILYFDTHAHPNDAKYADDRVTMLEHQQSEGVACVAIGTMYETSAECIALAAQYPLVWAAVGIHPVDKVGELWDTERFERLVKGEKVVAVGECGLDYFRGADAAEKERQAFLFRQQIQFALQYDKALVLHVRPSPGTTDAHDDALFILSEYATAYRGICHFFTSTSAVAQHYIALGFYIAFPGVITFAPELAVVVQSVSLQKIVAETDSPYAAPVPFRGKRNEPMYVREVYEKIAELKGVPLEEVREQLTLNARKVYRV